MILVNGSNKIRKVTGTVRLNSRNQYTFKRILKKIKSLEYYRRGILPNIKNFYLYDSKLKKILNQLKLFQLLSKLYYFSNYSSRKEKIMENFFFFKCFVQKKINALKSIKILKFLKIKKSNKKFGKIPIKTPDKSI